MLMFKKYFIGAFIALAIVISAKLYISHVESVAYNEGYEKANAAWVKKANEYKLKIDNLYDQNNKLNHDLTIENAKRIAAEDALSKDMGNLIIDYSKSEKGKEVFMDNEIIDIYNKSLGE